MILDELEGQKALSGPGRVNHGSTAMALQQRRCRFIGYLVVRVKLHRRFFLPSHDIIGIMSCAFYSSSS